MKMPRHTRTQSATGIYHVMLRGINQTQLFFEDEDRLEFLARLERFKDAHGYSLYAYCLMGNHVHLLIKEGGGALAQSIKSLAQSYSHWFNAKYDRSGYLFQGRYKSEPVEDDAYLLTVLRYIHNNPVKVGDTVTTWTSYEEYTKAPRLVDTGLTLAILDPNQAKALKLFKQLIAEQEPQGAEVLGQDQHKRLRDAEAIEIIKDIGSVKHPSGLQDMDKTERDRVLALLKKEGLSIRQISRLTEINRGIVLKAGRQ
jgi:REP element-mobilizing transposase RayT